MIEFSLRYRTLREAAPELFKPFYDEMDPDKGYEISGTLKHGVLTLRAIEIKSAVLAAS